VETQSEREKELPGDAGTALFVLVRESSDPRLILDSIAREAAIGQAGLFFQPMALY
jgi:hypothetical protein